MQRLAADAAMPGACSAARLAHRTQPLREPQVLLRKTATASAQEFAFLHGSLPYPTLQSTTALRHAYCWMCFLKWDASDTCAPHMGGYRDSQAARLIGKAARKAEAFAFTLPVVRWRLANNLVCPQDNSFSMGSARIVGAAWAYF